MEKVHGKYAFTQLSIPICQNPTPDESGLAAGGFKDSHDHLEVLRTMGIVAANEEMTNRIVLNRPGDPNGFILSELSREEDLRETYVVLPTCVKGVKYYFQQQISYPNGPKGPSNITNSYSAIAVSKEVALQILKEKSLVI